jgi:hypothetical protein
MAGVAADRPYRERIDSVRLREGDRALRGTLQTPPSITDQFVPDDNPVSANVIAGPLE